MASVTFPVAIGGDGSTVSDDSNASTGLANGGHRTRFVPALGQLVNIGNLIVPLSQNALNSPGTSATSTSSVTIGTGSKSLTLAQVGKAFAVGQWVQITDLAAPRANYMMGAITAFNAGTGAMTVDVGQIAGTGTKTLWAVHPASPIGNEFQTIGADGSLALTGAGALGYGVGAGGVVTQLTSKSTAVTLNKPNGQITMHNASLAAGASVGFPVNCTACGAEDFPVARYAGGGSAGAYTVSCEVAAAGAFVISVHNRTAGALAEALVLKFMILKGSVA